MLSAAWRVDVRPGNAPLLSDLAKAKHRACAEMLFVLVPLGAVTTALTAGEPSKWPTFAPLLTALLLMLFGGLYTMRCTLPHGMRAVLERLTTTEVAINLLVVVMTASLTATRYAARMGCPPFGPISDVLGYVIGARQFLVRTALADAVIYVYICANLPIVWAGRHRPLDAAAASAGELAMVSLYGLMVTARIRSHLRRAQLERAVLPPELQQDDEGEGVGAAPPAPEPLPPLQPLEVVRGGLRQATDSVQEIGRIVGRYRRDRLLMQKHGHGLLLLCMQLHRLDIELPPPAALRIASFLGSVREADPPAAFGQPRCAAVPSSDGELPDSEALAKPILHMFQALFGCLA